MLKRGLCLIPIFAVCLAAAPEVGRQASGAVAPMPRAVVSKAELPELVASNPLAIFSTAIANYERDVQGYSCLLCKQETLGGKLGQPEVIRMAVRDQPFAVVMVWEQGAGSAKSTLYRTGDGGRMHVRTNFNFTITVDPSAGSSSSRYSIEDAGVYKAMLRSQRAWQANAVANTLKLEYRGRKMIPELGRECHVVHRTCVSPEIDTFRFSDPLRDPVKHPRETFTSVTLYFDATNWLQLGSELWKSDGVLYGRYFFKDLQLNPKFAADQFTPEFLAK